ncbi:GH25 family lysozyme [Lactiplantibacillus nangangensis]|uniref:GH25 family lysozyme n=1 Tax=Lactiplantibacillus nangangensis TaxID=2559917 RepID=A0ABW1SND3_9LACO|nr:GH25 family lysozyme [Lactiplantibacillus nangangensis]
MKQSNWGLIGLAGLVAALGLLMPLKGQAATLAIPDISEWQGRLTATQVQQMKPHVSFVINRRQYGANYVDKDAANNTALYVKYGVPFGEYDFSQFTSVASARQEARDFYARSNKAARFYVLDFEVNTVKSGSTNAAVAAWEQQMRALTTKKLVFYSYQSFATTYANTSRQLFNAQWIADYTARTPQIPYAMWQYTDHFYMAGLNKYVDNSQVATWVHPVSWWLTTDTVKPTAVKSVRRVIEPKKVVIKAKPTTIKRVKAKPHKVAAKKMTAKVVKTAVKPRKHATKKIRLVKRPRVKSVKKVVVRHKINWAYSQYIVGQAVKLKPSAVRYYGSQTKIASAAKHQLLKVTAVKKVKTSHSLQAVYVAALHHWVLAQDVTGYWVGQHGVYTVLQPLRVYRDAQLKRATTTKLAAGQQVTARLVKVGTMTVLKTRNGYLSGQVTSVAPADFEKLPADHWVRAKVSIAQYRRSRFTKANLLKMRLRAGQRIVVKKLVKRSDGSHYFVTSAGHDITANQAQVTT